MPPLPNTPTAGLVVLYKPQGWSSAQYAYRLRSALGTRRVGHAGALDPFADGVLLACVGAATKLVERLMDLPKTYRTTLRLGVTNPSFDTEWPFEPVPGAHPPDRAALDPILAGFVGEIEQAPPDFSAVKIAGRPSYELARQGKIAPRPARRVRIHAIRLLEYDWPRLTLEIRCGRGTYIRAIARDLGRSLGCGACCERLTRSAVGPFRVESAVNLDTASAEQVRDAVMSIEAVKELLAQS